MSKNYIIYMHTFQTSQKSYIGLTNKGLVNRLHKHFTNAMLGIDTFFYKAIRKYGMSDIKSIIIYDSLTYNEALEKEKECIKAYNTLVPNGYNLTLGGNGGNICGNLPEEKYSKYLEKRRKATGGDKNPNFSGISDYDIIEKAVEFFKLNNQLILRRWFIFCKTIKYPQQYTKCRFNGLGTRGFFLELKKRLTELNIPFNDENFLYIRKNDRLTCEKIANTLRNK